MDRSIRYDFIMLKILCHLPRYKNYLMRKVLEDHRNRLVRVQWCLQLIDHSQLEDHRNRYSFGGGGSGSWGQECWLSFYLNSSILTRSEAFPSILPHLANQSWCNPGSSSLRTWLQVKSQLPQETKPPPRTQCPMETSGSLQLSVHRLGSDGGPSPLRDKPLYQRTLSSPSVRPMMSA